MKAFKERLLMRGKKAKVILTAVARKLLVVANAVVRTGRPREPEMALARWGSANDLASKRALGP